jgi:hypothetical protein
VLPSSSTCGSSDGATSHNLTTAFPLEKPVARTPHRRNFSGGYANGVLFSHHSASPIVRRRRVSDSLGPWFAGGHILLSFENSPPDAIPADERNDIVPGRGDLRISLTSACNLRCSYCHNEGQSAPWLQPAKISARFGNIESLLEVATKYGVKSVKFSGGDPGVYPDLLALTKAFAAIFVAGVLLSGCVTDGRPVVPPPDLASANSTNSSTPTLVMSTAEDPTRIPKNTAPTEEQCKTICSDAQARIFNKRAKRIFQRCWEQKHCIYVKAPPPPQ